MLIFSNLKGGVFFSLQLWGGVSFSQILSEESVVTLLSFYSFIITSLQYYIIEENSKKKTKKKCQYMLGHEGKINLKR